MIYNFVTVNRYSYDVRKFNIKNECFTALQG